MKFPLLWEDLDQVLEYHKALGVPYLICPNAGDWTDPPRTVEKLVRIKKKVEAAGLSFLYHNHNHEFLPVNGQRPVDLVVREMQMELDIFWAWVAGEDVAAYLTARADTVRFLHVKDGNRNPDTVRGGLSCALGEGSLPLADILRTARRLGKDDWFIYENDVSENSVAQAKTSLAALHRCMD